MKVCLSRPLTGTEWLAAVSLTAMMLTYGSKGPQFYLTWAVAASVAAIVGLLAAGGGRLPKSSVKIWAFCLAWIAYALAMTQSATDVNRHLETILLHVLYVTSLIAVLGASIGSLRVLVRVIGFCSFFWLAANFILLVGYIVGLLEYERDFSGVYYNRNTLAVSGAVLLAFWIFFERRFRAEYGRSVVAITIVFFVAIVLSSLSTKGLLAVTVLAVLKILLSRDVRSVLALALVSLSAAVVIAVAGGAIIERTQQKLAALTMVDREAELVGNSGVERLALLLASARVIAEHPWTGVGVDNGRYHVFTPRFFIRYSRGMVDDVTEGTYSHNNYTEMLLNAGIPAFVLYYSPIFWLLIRYRKRARVPRRLDDLRHFILAALTLKLTMDVGMVSYNDLSHLLAVIGSWLLHHRFLKPATQVETMPEGMKELTLEGHAG